MLKSKLVLPLVLLSIAQPLFGYVLEGQSWTLDRTVQMQFSLGGPTPLIDGSASFNEVAQDAINIWNPYLAHLQFSGVSASPVTPAQNDDEQSVFFSSTIFGDTFGDGTLAITLLTYRGSTFEETDTIFNTHYVWDSYRGPLMNGLQDFRRVAIHEFGHTLGLDHPDDHGQHVAAIMNSHISDIEVPQADDIAGVKALYATGPAYLSAGNGPVLANLSTRGFIGTNEQVLIGGFIVQGPGPATLILRAIGFSLASVGLSNALFDPTITVYDADNNQVAFSDDWFVEASAEKIASYHLDPPNSRESALFLSLNPGSYTAIARSYSDNTTPPATGIGLFELYDLQTTGGRAGNISTRGEVLSGDEVLIGGLIVGGTDSKPIIVRAIGPSLAPLGVNGALSDPTLELHGANGELLQLNDNWADGPDAQTITDNDLAPTDPKESALFATLAPGPYTAIVTGVGGATGVALVEVYDISPAP